MIPKLRHYTKQTLTNSCAAIVVYSLSLVMAGSGDLETLRCIRQVRNHLTDPPSVESDSFIYGVQTFCNTALGFLFLGNARYGFSQSTEATAMLLISSYPIFSQSICDQKHYFQPLRFLWSIATEYRHLTPVDDSSYEAIRMQAKITVAGENEKPLILQLPSVLPPLSSIKKIVFYARDYKEVELDMSNAEDKAELEKVLKEYFGRFPVKKVVKQYSKVFDSPPVFKLSDTFDCAPIRNDSFLLNLPLG
uniref:Anaphase-promoting complex subunit 1 n=1 Tax=Panagrolaimus davidi TaxID=227884 RepID=A0A914R514_9BILA